MYGSVACTLIALLGHTSMDDNMMLYLGHQLSYRNVIGCSDSSLLNSIGNDFLRTFRGLREFRRFGGLEGLGGLSILPIPSILIERIGRIGRMK